LVDIPTLTPRKPQDFTYATCIAVKLGRTFIYVVGSIVNDSQPDTNILS